MSKLFEKFWDENFLNMAPCTRQQAYIIWQACKAEAIRLIREDIRTNIILGKQTVEKVLENL